MYKKVADTICHSTNRTFVLNAIQTELVKKKYTIAKSKVSMKNMTRGWIHILHIMEKKNETKLNF